MRIKKVYKKRVCAMCHKEYEPKNKSWFRLQKFCSTKCRLKGAHLTMDSFFIKKGKV